MLRPVMAGFAGQKVVETARVAAFGLTGAYYAVEGLHEARHRAEGAVVAHLEELPHRHRARLAEAVVAIF